MGDMIIGRAQGYTALVGQGIFGHSLNFSDRSQQPKMNKNNNFFFYLLIEKWNLFRPSRLIARNPAFINRLITE